MRTGCQPACSAPSTESRPAQSRLWSSWGGPSVSKLLGVRAEQLYLPVVPVASGARCGASGTGISRLLEWKPAFILHGSFLLLGLLFWQGHILHFHITLLVLVRFCVKGQIDQPA